MILKPTIDFVNTRICKTVPGIPGKWKNECTTIWLKLPCGWSALRFFIATRCTRFANQTLLRHAQSRLRLVLLRSTLRRFRRCNFRNFSMKQKGKCDLRKLQARLFFQKCFADRCYCRRRVTHRERATQQDILLYEIPHRIKMLGLWQASRSTTSQLLCVLAISRFYRPWRYTFAAARFLSSLWTARDACAGRGSGSSASHPPEAPRTKIVHMACRYVII